VVFLLALALAVRAHALTTAGLYRDDAWPMLATRTDLGRAVRIGVTIPGFELFVRAWGGLSSSTPWVQAPTLLASLSGVALVYLLARHLGCGPSGALAAGGILALAPVAVLFATRVKPYAFDALSCLLLLSLAVRLAERPSNRRWAALVATAVAAPVVSASVLPVALTAVTWCAWRTWRDPEATVAARRAGLAIVVGYTALVALYALLVLGNVPPPLHDSWASHYVDGLASARFVVDELAAGIFYRHGPTGPLLLAAVCAGVVWARSDLAPLLLGPIALAFGVAVFDRAPFGGGRTDVYLFPCVALAVALTFDKALARRVPALAVGAALVLVAATISVDHATQNPYPGADTAELIAAVRSQMAPGDALVVAPFTRYAFALYDRPRPDVILSPRYSTGFTVVSSDQDVLILPAEYYETGYDASAAVAFARDRRRVWYLTTDTPRSDTPPEVQAHEYEPARLLAADGFVLERRIDVAGAHAELLVRPG